MAETKRGGRGIARVAAATVTAALLAAGAMAPGGPIALAGEAPAGGPAVAPEALGPAPAAATPASGDGRDVGAARAEEAEAERAVAEARAALEDAERELGDALREARERAVADLARARADLESAQADARGVTPGTVGEAGALAEAREAAADGAEGEARDAALRLPRDVWESDDDPPSPEAVRDHYAELLAAARPDGEVALTPDTAVDAVNNAQQNVNEAQKKLEDDVNSTKPIRDQAHRGSIGFFDSEFSIEIGTGTVTNQRSQAAIDILTNTSVMEQNTNTVLSSYTELDADGHYVNATDAINLSNMIDALNWIEWCNEHVRKPNGLPEYKVTHSLMASAQRNANFSTLYDEHGYPHAVPSVWTYNAENMAYGYASPGTAYEMWFTREKAVWEQAVLNDPRLADHVSDLASYDPNLYHQVGHYLNLLDSSYLFTGLGINDSNYTSVQHFAASVGSEAVYTVAEYRALFDAYYKAHVTDMQDMDTTNFTTLQHAKHALDAAKKQAAYVIAKAMVDDPASVDGDAAALLQQLNGDLAKAAAALAAADRAESARREATAARAEHDRLRGLLDALATARAAFDAASARAERAAALTEADALAGTVSDPGLSHLNGCGAAVGAARRALRDARAEAVAAHYRYERAVALAGADAAGAPAVATAAKADPADGAVAGAAPPGPAHGEPAADRAGTIAAPEPATAPPAAQAQDAPSPEGPDRADDVTSPQAVRRAEEALAPQAGQRSEKTSAPQVAPSVERSAPAPATAGTVHSTRGNDLQAAAGASERSDEATAVSMSDSQRTPAREAAVVSSVPVARVQVPTAVVPATSAALPATHDPTGPAGVLAALISGLVSLVVGASRRSCDTRG